MFEEYRIHNLFSVSLDEFVNHDPHLSFLTQLRFVHPLDWWRELDWTEPGLYLLTGGRQIGKTTSTKLLIKAKLSSESFLPEDIFYLPCDQIDTHHGLSRILRLFLEGRTGEKPFLLIVDEVTYVKEWDRAIKALADEGRFRRGFCIITGSDSIVLKEAIARFPGRRGEAHKTDFQLRPLRFRDYVELVDSPLLSDNTTEESIMQRFLEYLQCGGHLRAINDLHAHGKILPATHAVFEQWLQGDIEKRKKSREVLQGVLKVLLETAGSQVTYASLTQRLGEVTKDTFLDYCSLLERLDVLFELQAFDQNKRIGFPKKARKIHFWDPFILDTVRLWLAREGMLSEAKAYESIKAEAIVAAYFKHDVPTYYVKGKGEIDVVALVGKRALYVEVKWAESLRSWDFEELKKHRPALLLAKQGAPETRDGVQILSLPRFLLSKVPYASID